ncbi:MULTISPECIES: PH domain-containing protein [Nonomuraea]|uniref:PH domain-containing protein n=1 Tax=Nonomuraea mangrovi TaxID=2316207 RepID=A0ABW4SPY6_9ACTN
MTLPDHHLTQGERRIRSFHPHWKRLVGPAVALVLILAATGVGLYLIPGGWEFALYGRAAVIVIAVILLTIWSFVPYLQWKNTGYVLTTHRFTISTGVLNKSTDEIPLTKVNSVSSDQSFAERMLGCGTLTVESASDQGQLALRDIPRIQDVRADLFRAVEDVSDGDVDGR